MKLVIAIVHDEDGLKISDELNAHGYSVTKLCSTGGFLRAGNTTLMAGVEDHRLDEAVSIIAYNSEPRSLKLDSNANKRKGGSIPLPGATEIVTSGATIFVTNVARFEKF